MSDLMREEFEAWAITNAFLGLSESCMERHKEGYLSCELHAAWEAWQASRECLVIELPEPYAWDNDGGFERKFDPESECSMALIPTIDARQAIHAAGVKTK